MSNLNLDHLFNRLSRENCDKHIEQERAKKKSPMEQEVEEIRKTAPFRRLWDKIYDTYHWS